MHFNARALIQSFIYYCYIGSCKLCIQIQLLTLFAAALNVITSPICLYIVIVKYVYKIYLINFIFVIVQPLENQCFLSTDHWIFLYDYTKEGNILLRHIYLICYKLCQQACTKP